MKNGIRFCLPYLSLNLLTQIIADDTKVTVRAFGVLNNAEAASRSLRTPFPSDEARDILSEHAANSKQVTATPAGSYLTLDAIPGTFISGTSEPAYVYELSQIGFNLDPEIVGSGAWSEYGLWLFDCDLNGTMYKPYNRTLETYLSKEHRHFFIDRTGRVSILHIAVPFVENHLNRTTMYFKYNPVHGCFHNFANPTHMPIDENPAVRPHDRSIKPELYGVIAHMKIAGPDTIPADGKADYTVSTIDPVDGSPVTDEMTIYAESDAGYIPLRKRVTSNGEAVFSVRALDLPSGSVIKLKAGYRYFTGMAEKIIQVE